MTKQLLFYEKVVPITKQSHGDLAIKPEGGLSFASETNSIPIMTVEFQLAAREYAIVFTGSGEAIMPAVIVGIENNRNLFVSPDGTWNATYIPAFVRRYPFVFSADKEGKTFTLCVDENYAGCNKKDEGERLFDKKGERTEYLERMLNFVNSYQAEHQRTQAFCNRLKELDLLEPMQARIKLPSGEERSLTGFLAANRDKVKNLDGNTLSELAKNDSLELLYLHLASMAHFNAIPGMADKAGNSSGTKSVKT
jgi:hypothetical protein